MALKRKTNRNYTAFYQLLIEPELKQRLIELRTFYEIDVPEHIRELIRAWVEKAEKEILK